MKEEDTVEEYVYITSDAMNINTRADMCLIQLIQHTIGMNNKFKNGITAISDCYNYNER